MHHHRDTQSGRARARSQAPSVSAHPTPPRSLLKMSLDQHETSGSTHRHDHLPGSFYFQSPINYSPVERSSIRDQWSVGGSRARSVSAKPNRDRRNPALTKTKICDHWRRSGTCSYGDLCWYAHGEDDLRKVNFARIGRTDAEKSKENERPPFPYRRPPLPSADELMELAKSTKSGVDEKFATSSAPGNKRASINVKGLTVNIPATAAQVSNASLPLSPAQERWVSMSGQQSVTPVSKSNESLPCAPKIEGLDENGLEKRQMATQFGREDDLSAAIDDSAAFLSPNPFAYSQPGFAGRLPSNNSTLYSHHSLNHHQNPHHRSYSRGPHRRNPAAPFPAASAPLPRLSRATAGGGATTPYGFISPIDRQNLAASSLHQHHQQHQQQQQQHHAHRSASSTMRISSREIPHLQQAIWNVAGELYQRQKDVETDGSMYQIQQKQKPGEELEAQRMLAKISKMKDMASLRYLFERGLLTERHVPREVWNELVNNPPMLSHYLGLNNNNNNVHDCTSCGGTARPAKEHTSLHSRFTQQQQHPSHYPFPAHQHHHSHNSQNHHPQPHVPCLRRPAHHHYPFGTCPTPAAELSAPPKIFESLLPADDTFSIWLDPKPKRADTFLRPPPPPPATQAQLVEHSDSTASLLTKMEALRLEKFPITDEEMASASGAKPRIEKETLGSEKSSPTVFSLMELLSSENLLDNDSFSPSVSPKLKTQTTMFDFDSLKIAETLRMATFGGAASRTGSPGFLLVDDKTPRYDDIVGVTSLTDGKKAPSFMEQCDFFIAGGSCPFGDGCHLSHSIRNETKSLQ